jgi:hypothetical protein
MCSIVFYWVKFSISCAFVILEGGDMGSWALGLYEVLIFDKISFNWASYKDLLAMAFLLTSGDSRTFFGVKVIYYVSLRESLICFLEFCWGLLITDERSTDLLTDLLSSELVPEGSLCTYFYNDYHILVVSTWYVLSIYLKSISCCLLRLSFKGLLIGNTFTGLMTDLGE